MKNRTEINNIFSSINEVDFIDVDSQFSLNEEKTVSHNQKNDTTNSYDENLLKRSTWDNEEEETPSKDVFNSTNNDINYNEENLSILSTWDDDDDELDIKEPFLKEIHVYNSCIPRDENFEDGISPKYFLTAVHSSGIMSVEEKIPDQFSKVVYDLNQIEEYGSSPEMMIVDYDTIFGLRLTSFLKYNSNFFSCDERVFFEALLIKYKAFVFKPFYWSKEIIFQELGIKKDRATKIINKMKALEILTTEVRKSVLNNRPQQITYFMINKSKIMELASEIYKEREDDNIMLNDLKKYLNIKKD
ncbi:hypothetical protein PL373_18540 [Tenacibaculum maritimum]|nr:hypothetical protein [Tenacibaculum maritimum]MDB0603088.1 hypothetical protein [Tenacibaculum maritimum]MDB0611658.1 hypothetical protein [Tenacibaculum maritimum]